MSEVIRLDMDALTLGDLEDFEEYVGASLQDAMREKPVIDPDTGKPQRDDRGRLVKEVQLTTKALTGIVWVVKRHDSPGLKVEAARDIRVSELEIVSPVEDAEGKAEGASA